MNASIKAEFATSFDGGDPWGSAISWAFSACDILTDEGVSVPSELGYRQAMGGSETEAYEYEALRDLLDWEFVTVEDIVHFVLVLSRYLDLCKRKGLNY